MQSILDTQIPIVDSSTIEIPEELTRKQQAKKARPYGKHSLQQHFKALRAVAGDHAKTAEVLKFYRGY